MLYVGTDSFFNASMLKDGADTTLPTLPTLSTLPTLPTLPTFSSIFLSPKSNPPRIE